MKSIFNEGGGHVNDPKKAMRCIILGRLLSLFWMQNSSPRVVLVSPKYAGNVGACARLLANFGVSAWTLVGPRCRLKSVESEQWATGPSKQLLETVTEAATLREAAGDYKIVVGFTRRLGATRAPSVELQELHCLPRESLALVFGSEDNGLNEDDLNLCTHICTIPTDPHWPSLNLSHAVAIALSRMMTAPQSNAVVEDEERITMEEMERLMDHWSEFLTDAGMVTAGNPARLVKKLRRLFQRSLLTANDLAVLHAILSKAQVSLGTRQRGRRVEPSSQPQI